jgi:hypothetical protein
MAVIKKVGNRPGKSKGKCFKCGKEFLLNRSTKHNKRIIKAHCGC